MADQNETTITINPARESELEFEVAMSGIDDYHLPNVRFVATSEAEECDYSFRCRKVEGQKHKWKATIPALKHINENSMTFRVEVIIDGYFFEPAQGKLILVNAPEAVMKKKAPLKEDIQVSVSSFVAEMSAGGGGENTNSDAPNNSLLVPELNPDVDPHNIKNINDAAKRDQTVDTNRLDTTNISDLGTMTPGDSPRGQPEPDGKGNTDEGDHEDPSMRPRFDPKGVAESIIKEKMGTLTKPAVKGTLFKRDKAGKAVIKGLDSAETKSAREEKSARVRDILKKA